MLEVCKFLRVRNNRLEVLIAGLANEFSIHAKNSNPPIPIKHKYRIEWISSKIKESLTNSNVKFLVLDCRMEDYFTYVIAKGVIESLGLRENEVIILASTNSTNIFNGYTVILDILSDVNLSYFYSNLLERQVDWGNIQITVPVMSLAGRPTESRARLIRRLLDICGDKIRASLGNLLHCRISLREHKLYENILNPYPFPLLQNTDRKFQDYPNVLQDYVGDNLFESLLAIVNETHEFNDANVQLSEKSFKHFAWHQIPIFNASRGHVEVVRNLGFDVFDDIIDHSYDTAPNSHLQELKILSVVAKFLKDYPTLEDVNNLRKSIFPRLQANNDLLYKFNQERLHEPWPIFG